MDKKESHLKYLLDNQLNIHSEEVLKGLKEYGIKLGEHPYKLYGVTYDGNGNEVCVFLDAFSTIEECKQEPITDEQYHDRLIDLEEDYD